MTVGQVALATSAARTIFVPRQAPSIQSAIDESVSGDLILVAPGTYRENVDFDGKAIAVRSVAGPRVTIIDGRGLAPVVRFTQDEPPAAVLAGFTLRDGSAMSQATGIDGGGVDVEQASPTIENDVIEGNSALNGAGISTVRGQPIIRGNVIRDNISPPQSNGYGGGIFIGAAISPSGSLLSPQIIGNRIIDNVSDQGAGIGMDLGGSTVVLNNVLSGNRATYDGGAFDDINTSAPSLVQNLIVENEAGEGSALYLDANAGGAVAVNNTIADNLPSNPYYPGASVYLAFAGIAMYNNIVEAPPGDPGLSCGPLFSPLAAIDNDVFSYGGTAVDSSCGPFGGSDGNFSSDPDLDRHYRLAPQSPAINAGDDSAPLLPRRDLAGRPRTRDGFVDLGAYESR